MPQADRPARSGSIVVPPLAYRAEGPQSARLNISKDEVVFNASDVEARHVPAGIDRGLQMALRELARARSRPAGAQLRADGQSRGVLNASLLEIGRRLGTRFVDGAVGHALAEQVARSRGRGLRLAVQVDDLELANLPWETLVLPGQDVPLVLPAGVDLYRAITAPEAVAASTPGPLRILAVVGSPDSGGGEVLDYEAELARVFCIGSEPPSGRGVRASAELGQSRCNPSGTG